MLVSIIEENGFAIIGKKEYGAIRANQHTDKPKDYSIIDGVQGGHWEYDKDNTPPYKFSSQVCMASFIDKDDCVKAEKYCPSNLTHWVYKDRNNRRYPRFDVSGFRRNMRNSRIIFVGSSLIRQQVQALVWTLGHDEVEWELKKSLCDSDHRCMLDAKSNITICFQWLKTMAAKIYHEGNFTLDHSLKGQVGDSSCLLHDEMIVELDEFDLVFVQGSIAHFLSLPRVLNSSSSPFEWVEKMVPELYYDAMDAFLSKISRRTKTVFVLGQVGTSCANKIAPEPFIEDNIPHKYGWNGGPKLWNVSLTLIHDNELNVQVIDARDPLMQSETASHPHQPTQLPSMRRSLPRLCRRQVGRLNSTTTAENADAGNHDNNISSIASVALRRGGIGRPSGHSHHRIGRVLDSPSTGPSLRTTATATLGAAFHSAVACGARDLPPRRDQAGHGNDRNSDGKRADVRQGGDGGRGRRIGRGRSDDRRVGDPLPPSFVDMAELAKRAEEQIRSRPVDPSIDTNIRDGGGVISLSSWYRTTAKLIMLMSKLWGRGNDHRSEDPHQFLRVVTLANDLLDRFMTLNENEIDGALRKSGSESSDAPSNDDRRHPHRRVRRDAIGHHDDRTPDLCTEILCQAVALGWSRCNPEIAIDAARNSQAILERLEGIRRGRGRLRDDADVTFDTRDVTPTKFLYNHVLSCWSRSSDPDAEVRARALLDRMIESREVGALAAFSRPDTFSYNNMLNLYATRGDVEAAEALLRRMEKSADVESPDVYSYSITMNAFQRRFTSSSHDNRDMQDLERAEEILSRLASQYERSGFRDVKLRPTNVTFGTIMSMYAQADRMLKQDDRDGHKTRKWKADQKLANIADETKNVGWGAKNAERVLDWMIGMCERERRSKNVVANTDIGVENIHVRHGGFDHDNALIRPTTRNFVTVMDAWAKAGKGVEGAQHCQRLLDRLVSLYEKFGYVELRPNPKFSFSRLALMADQKCFGTVIDAWSKADDKYQTAEKAESVLEQMEVLFLHSESNNPKEMLSNIAYNSVIDAWSRRPGKDTAERAEQILRRLVTNYRVTNNRFLAPDVITYTGVMKAYVNHPEGGLKALAILEEMNNQCIDGNRKARPDVQALAVAMDACAKSGLTSAAEGILEGIEDSKKSEVLFNTIISGYKREGRGHEAEAVLRRMISLEKSGWSRCRPDMITYALCIEAWGNSTSEKRVSRVRALLDESIQRYQDGDVRCKPTNVTFNVAAESIANSNCEDTETQVLSLFETMEEIGCEPNLISFNIQIKNCAIATGSVERKMNALRIAVAAFNSLPSVGLRPDSITYTGMIHALLNLMDDSAEKFKAISGIFRQCCDEGCLNPHILNVLAASTSEDDYLSITGASTRTEFSSLPAEWSRRSTRDSISNNVE
ncbi:hypothetical protein ACHAW5_007720 [Stephanodiscus triporus]|uniref:Pentacotripeptide-repeat region of PRORP domain-containing protein n=1 Tax=Stephanodiscus triporus TaxID=2934178 RepID=A0ABD3MKF1_9STRA